MKAQCCVRTVAYAFGLELLLKIPPKNENGGQEGNGGRRVGFSLLFGHPHLLQQSVPSPGPRAGQAGQMRLLRLRVPRPCWWQEQRSSANPQGPHATQLGAVAMANPAQRQRQQHRRRQLPHFRLWFLCPARRYVNPSLCGFLERFSHCPQFREHMPASTEDVGAASSTKPWRTHAPLLPNAVPYLMYRTVNLSMLPAPNLPLKPRRNR